MGYIDTNNNTNVLSSTASYRVSSMRDIDGDGDLDIYYNDDDGNLRYVDSSGNMSVGR